MDRLPRVTAFALATVLAIVSSLAVGPAPKATASPAAPGDFSGLVDIGGRSLYLECRGQGSPTVILESGAGGRADVWSRDLEKPEGTRTMVLPGVAAFSCLDPRHLRLLMTRKATSPVASPLPP